MPLRVRDLVTVLPKDWAYLHWDLADAINTNPDLAWRVDGTSEYIIGGRWRRRTEIGSIEELLGRKHRHRLIAHLSETLRNSGALLLVLSSHEQERNLGIYLAEGFGVVDEIVRYQRDGTSVRSAGPEVAIRPMEPGDLARVLAIDHAAFPWLWWNSEAEFNWYLSIPGVEAFVALDDERIVGYAGITISGHQGHLDRLAVHPDAQSRGFGKALVLHALEHMASRRVERVALTTQVDNYRSANLYRALGFVRTSIKYPIYGVWLDADGRRAPA